ncbi:MAG: hypothetical protein D6824_00495 [Planctomycetota bacterium]|nr:MAG: hypothetical protein D6824_00495 [Planctomycetota bacterium]
MPVIKPSTPTHAAAHAIAIALDDLRADAAHIIEEARRQARSIVEEAKAERRRLLDGAREEGFAQGQQQGYQQGLAAGREAGHAEALAEQRERIQSLLELWSAALDEFLEARSALLRQARADLLRLAVAVAAKVVKNAVAIDSSAVAQAQLEAALELALEPTTLRIRTHPADAHTLVSLAPQLARRFLDSPDIAIEEDDTLSPGDCVVRTDRGEIDERLHEQIARIAQAMLPGRAIEPPSSLSPDDDHKTTPAPPSPNEPSSASPPSEPEQP